MSVIIKGIEMPAVCDDCHFNYDCYRCSAIDGNKGYFFNDEDFDPSCNRLPDCPLIELPKHGRLIDADELMKYELQATLFPKGREAKIDVWTHAVAIGNIVNAETIIEADK